MPTVAIQYPSFGPQHPPRLRAIAAAAPSGWRVVAMEMFSMDSDYGWTPVATADEPFDRHTAMKCESEVGRRSPRMRSDVFRALDEIAPDVLVVNGWGHVESRASLDWARGRRCDTVLLSDSVYENVRRWWVKERYKRWVVRGCRSAFVAGTPQARYARRLGVPSDKIFHPGSCVVDNDYWREASARARARAAEFRSRLNLPKRYFLCVARFLDWKNLPFVVRAYAAYRRRSGDSTMGLVLVGAGPDEPNIRAAVAECGVDNVHLPGFLQADVTPTYYALACCFILPSSRFECWGLVVNEAMACGLPVLVSRMVGCAEDLVRDGVNGYTFDPFDPDKLAQRMGEVASDDALRTSMGRESERIIQGHSLAAGAVNRWRAVQAATA